MWDFRNLAMFFFGRYANAKFRRDAGGPFQRAALLGCCPQTTGQRPITPSESAMAPFDGRRLSYVFRLVKQMAEREGVTEQLKADNQKEWVARMNNIRSRATEIVNHDIIYN